MRVIKKYPFIKQNDLKDCGVSCLSMIINYYKGEVSLEYLRDLTKTNKNGTTAYHIIEASKQIGFESKGIKTTIEEINNNLVLPCIAHVTINQSYKHYIVIYEIDIKKKKLVIADPSSGIKTISYEEFLNIWNNILIILYPKESIVKYSNKEDFNKLISSILNKNKKLIINTVILSFFTIIFSIVYSFYLKTLIDNINKTKYIVLIIFLIFLSILILKFITEFFRNKVFIYINQKIDLNLIKNSVNNIILLPYKFYSNRTSGDIISRVNDISIIKDYISKMIISFGVDIPIIIISFSILGFINLKLLLISIITLLLFILVSLIIFKYSKNYVLNIQQDKSKMTSVLFESLSNYETVKGLSIEEETMNKFNKKLVSLLNSVFKYENFSNMLYSFKEIIYSLSLLFLIFIGINLVITKDISLGMLLTYESIQVYLISSVKNIVDFNSLLNEGKSAINRVVELYYYKSDNGIVDKKIKGNISVKDLSFSYDDKYNIIDNLSVDIKNKDKVLILGSSGSGKSTFLKLLMRYYEVDRNKIFIDNIDINDYKETPIKENICYISQKENLFTDTIYNNILLNRNISNEDILYVSGLCKLNTLVDKSNLGFNMLVEENGFNISGGERQKIVLTRSLLKNFNILLMDEALNEIDIYQEEEILKNIFNEFDDKTIIVVSHRKTNLELFNKIFEFKNGKLCTI